MEVLAKNVSSSVYSSQVYPRRLLNQLNCQRNNGQFCDVEIIADGAKFPAHKSILSASSAYFNAMFSAGLKEQEQKSVEIQLISATVCKAIIDFIYSGNIEISSNNVQELIIAADMLNLDEVFDLCIKFLKRELDVSNALGIYRFAQFRFYGDLTDTAEKFINSNFPKVSLEDEFVALPRDLLLYFLSSEYLRVDAEVQVFNSALRWINHDVEQRRCFIFDLLRHIRLPLLAISHIESAIHSCSDVSLKVALRSIRKDLVTKKGSLVSLSSVRPRLAARKNIYVIGGARREPLSSWTRSPECFTYKSVLRFDTFHKDWSLAKPMMLGRVLPGVAALDGRIYVVGGEEDCQILANGECYDPLEGSWTTHISVPSCCNSLPGVSEPVSHLKVDQNPLILPCFGLQELIASMVVPRCEFGLCALDGILYAMGGWVGEDLGQSMERYDPTVNEWCIETNLPEPLISMGVVAYEGLIYIVGGCTQSKRHLQDFRSFNPVTREWCTLPNMTVCRSQMGVSILDGYLYAVGGTNRQNQVLQSAERYSFKDNKWSPIPSMLVGRTCPAVAAGDGLLYVMGGLQTQEVNFWRAQITVSSVECYDPMTNRWRESEALPETRGEAGAVVI